MPSTQTIIVTCRRAGNFHDEKINQFRTCSRWQEFLTVNSFSCVNDYIDVMATFTALAK